MDASSEWWCWSNDHYTTTPSGLGGDCSVFLYNIKTGQFICRKWPNGDHTNNWERDITYQEYQPISEEEAILLMLKHGFTG